MASPKVYIVILNFNEWADTLECLESIAKLTFPNYKVIVVDNCSQNDSVAHIQEWATGRCPVRVPESNPLRHLSYPPVSKPLLYKEYSREEAETGGDRDDTVNLVLIQTGENLGFAGGNNVALRYILQKGDADYVWLLNNDTVVEPDSLSHLTKSYMSASLPEVGIMGGKVRYYHNPSMIQCIAGATYNKWTGYSRQIGNKQIDQGQYDNDSIQPDLIIGACMLVSIRFLRIVGLLSEEYFLYFEEQDWAERAKRAGFRLGYTTRAIIYHKEGGTIKANQWKGNSRFSDYYFTRSKILFTERYFGKVIRLTVKLSLIATLVNRLRRRQLDRIPLMIGVLANPRDNTLSKEFKK